MERHETKWLSDAQRMVCSQLLASCTAATAMAWALGLLPCSACAHCASQLLSTRCSMLQISRSTLFKKHCRPACALGSGTPTEYGGCACWQAGEAGEHGAAKAGGDGAVWAEP